MTKEEFFEKYKLVPEEEKDKCIGCCFDAGRYCFLADDDKYFGFNCKTGFIYAKKLIPRRLNAFEEIANRFEEWSGDQSHNGDDMAEVAKDVINADNAYLLWQIEELQSLDAEEFKQEVLKAIKTFK